MSFVGSLDAAKFCVFSRSGHHADGMEACAIATIARAIAALGHEVGLIPPANVKHLVSPAKTDAAEAEAIHGRVIRKTMRFLSTKTQQVWCDGAEEPAPFWCAADASTTYVRIWPSWESFWQRLRRCARRCHA